MTRLTSTWVNEAKPVAEHKLAGPLFALTGGKLSRDRAYDRTLLRFESTGSRTFPEAGFDLASVHAILVDRDGAVLIRRGHDSSRQHVIGPLTTWAHELEDEHLAATAALVYEVEARVDVRRVLIEGQLASLDLDREEVQLWRMSRCELAPDPLIQLAISMSSRRGDIDINVVGETELAHDGHRNELELEFLDEQGQPVGGRAFSLSIRCGDPIGFADTSLRLERRVQGAVRGFVLRGRTEVRGLVRVGPFRIDAARPRN